MLCIAVAPLLLHLATAGNYGLFRDEFYYLACARRLAWGYVDHPPFSIALLKAWIALFGDSVNSVRVIPALCASMTSGLGATLAWRMGGGAKAQQIAALSIAISPLLLGITGFYSMNALDLVLWSALFLMLVEFLRTGRSGLWITIGALAGLALLNKLGVLVWGAAVVVGLLATRNRRQFARWELWAGGLLAGVVFVPHVIWQARNDWATLEFLSNAAQYKNQDHSLIDFLLGLVVELHPLNAPIWLAGLVWLIVANRARPFRMLGITAFTIAALFFIQGGKVYYVAPLAPLLLAAGSVAVERGMVRWLPDRRASKAGEILVLGLLAVGGAVTAPLAAPVLNPEALVAYQQRLGLRAVQEEKDEVAELDQHFADRFGWEAMAEIVGEVSDALPEEERAGALVVTRNYGEAASMEYYAKRFRLPRIASGHNNYALWGYGETPQVVIGVGIARAKLEAHFGRVEVAARLDNRWAMPDEGRLEIYLCREPLRPFEEIWREFRVSI